MLGKPRYDYGDVVEFKVRDGNNILLKTGIIAIIDKYGTFFNNSDVSYDILVKDDNCLYKHFTESCVIRKVGEVPPEEVWNSL